MKANELRVGNLVYPNDENATPYPIIEIHEDYVVCFKAVMPWQVESNIRYDLIEPIPLTEEWLLKFGFEKMKHITHEWKDEWIIDYKNMGLSIGVKLGNYPESNPNCGCVSILLPKNKKVSAIPKDLYDKEEWTEEDEIRAANYKTTWRKWRQPIAYFIKYVHQLQNLYFALTGTELEIK
jgi:hypothetical protein